MLLMSKGSKLKIHIGDNLSYNWHSKSTGLWYPFHISIAVTMN